MDVSEVDAPVRVWHVSMVVVFVMLVVFVVFAAFLASVDGV